MGYFWSALDPSFHSSVMLRLGLWTTFLFDLMLLVGVCKQETLGGDTTQEKAEAAVLLPVLSASFCHVLPFPVSPQQHLFTLAEALPSWSSCWSQFVIITLAEPTFLHLSPRCQHLLKRLGPCSWSSCSSSDTRSGGLSFRSQGPSSEASHFE